MATLASLVTPASALRLSDSGIGSRVALRRRQPGPVVVRASGAEGNSIKVQQQPQQQQQKQQNGSSSLQRQPQQQQQQQQRSLRRQPSSLLSPLDLWDPFMPSSRTFGQMLDLMNQMVDATFPSTSTGPSASSPATQRGRSPWDVMEDQESFKMRVDMPGLGKDEVSVTIEDNRVLVIRGETSSERKEKDEWVARSSGSYESRVVLPENVEVEKIQAELKDGVLYVTVPKKKVEPPKQITVQVS